MRRFFGRRRRRATIAARALALILLSTAFREVLRRFEGHAQDTEIKALIQTAVICAAAATLLTFAFKRKKRLLRLMIYAGTGVTASSVATAYNVGLQGILPRIGGMQDIGFEALIANADLYALVVIAMALCVPTLLETSSSSRASNDQEQAHARCDTSHDGNGRSRPQPRDRKSKKL